MAINQDFSDLFAALNDAGAKYLLVGGYAVAFHAQPRFTKDLDVWVDREGKADVVFQIGVDPNRVDVITSIDGVTFPEAWVERETTRYANNNVPVISRRHLIRNKRASGRPQDLIDVGVLENM